MFVRRYQAMQDVDVSLEQAAGASRDLLITGEPGTGKNLVAREFHNCGPRKHAPLLTCDCGLDSGDRLLEELLSYGQETHVGEIGTQMDVLNAAQGGTLILDNIDGLRLEVQPALLRMLRNRQLQQPDDSPCHRVDVRVIALSRCDLSELVAGGGFLVELYHQLSAFQIHLLPLRERREDIPSLALHFLAEMRQQHNAAPTGFEPDTLQVLTHYRWPGNVRELRSVIRRACALAKPGSTVQVHHLPAQLLDSVQHDAQRKSTTSEPVVS